MNAGGVPNTCKSNGPYYDRDFGRRNFKVSGGRVSNAWRTCLMLGDNSEKSLLIPHKRTRAHALVWLIMAVLTVLCSTAAGKTALEMIRKDTFLDYMYGQNLFLKFFTEVL